MLVYLLEKKGWSSHRLQNLTTDSHGVASFSLNTTTMPKEDINLIVSIPMIPFERFWDSLCSIPNHPIDPTPWGLSCSCEDLRRFHWYNKQYGETSTYPIRGWGGALRVDLGLGLSLYSLVPLLLSRLATHQKQRTLDTGSPISTGGTTYSHWSGPLSLIVKHPALWLFRRRRNHWHVGRKCQSTSSMLS